MSESAKKRAKNEGFKVRSKRVKSFQNKEFSKKMSKIRKGRIFSFKLSDDLIKEIRERFSSFEDKNVGSKSKNGKVLTKEIVFSKKVCEEYGVTFKAIQNIVERKCLR